MQDANSLNNLMQNNPQNIAPPNTTDEFYTESFLGVLEKSIGYWVACEFLIGSNNIVEKSGILYAAGVNFLTLYDPDSDRYTICDFYSLKFVTVYNTKSRPQRGGNGRFYQNPGRV